MSGKEPTSNALTGLVMASAKFRAAAPEAFAEFVEALRAVEIQAITEMVAAGQADVFQAQGRIKGLQQIRRHIQECNELRDKFVRRAV